MKLKWIFLLLFCASLVLPGAGCSPPSLESQLVVEVAEVVDVSLGITDQGVVVTEAGVTIPIIESGILNVGWRTGVTWAKGAAQSTPNTLYVIYEDDAGNVVQNVYDIGKPFRITFQENEWTRTIEHLENGSIVVAVQVYGGGISDFELAAPSADHPCPGAAPQMVEVGQTVKVCTKSDNLIIRDAPGGSGSELFRMAPGTRFVLIGGPTCNDNSSWWQAEIPGGTSVRRGAYDAPLFTVDAATVGWVREGSDAIDEYFICPAP